MRFFLRPLAFFFISIFVFFQPIQAQVWKPDLGNGMYQNPIIWADYSDPDIIRVGKDFFMTASSFNCVPALPVLHSTDLVNWEIINHAVEHFPDSYYRIPQHGNGVWAPCIRFFEGWFYIYWGDPDRGIYMVRTQDPYGDWSAPVLVKKAFGNIDPSPLWDDDGKIYLVHAFANSRAGVSHVLQLQELNSEGSSVTQNRDIIIHGLPDNSTLEGPKFYKRNGFYYIFAPAGGVANGWQMVYRAKNIWGPYESRKVLAQGKTTVNGPHQGGWIELENGQGWFVHFQECLPYGRIVHLQPVKWVDEWPVIGTDEDGNGTGEPVQEFTKPDVENMSGIKCPQTSDEFDGPFYNLGWQWQADYFEQWYSMTENKGCLRLYAQYHDSPASLWMVPNILAQKLPGPQFCVTTKVDGSNLKQNEKAGLVMMGLDYATLTLSPGGDGFDLKLAVCKDAYRSHSEELIHTVSLKSGNVFLRTRFEKDGMCRFAYGLDGQSFTALEQPFKAREGRWIGAKIGIFAVSAQETGLKGYADFDWFRIE
ncbi:glycoside hydrolase 43 family protein [candidate division KSB1 bacterium]|nr:glycoside hydrolase 43 family protein [candidate division KSB1 bacterium]